MNLNLDPCPFCGSTEQIIHRRVFGGVNGVLVQVECDPCGAMGPLALNEGLDWQVEHLWNTRRPQTPPATEKTA